MKSSRVLGGQLVPRVLAFQIEQVLLPPQAPAIADELSVLPDDAVAGVHVLPLDARQDVASWKRRGRA